LRPNLIMKTNMKRKILFLPLLLWAGMAWAGSQLVIQPLTGQDAVFALSQIGRVQFANETMFLYDKSGGVLGSTPLSAIGRIVFADDGTSLVEANEQSVRVYPNPTHDMLIINGIESGQTIRIYSLHGMLVESVASEGAETSINVSGLQEGTYFLQLGAEVVKFIKK